jgi:glycine hydroxymethyltransferase
MTCNKNGVPFDTAPFTITSGIRLGTPAGTTRGFKEAEFTRVGELIGEVVNGLAANGRTTMPRSKPRSARKCWP